MYKRPMRYVNFPFELEGVGHLNVKAIVKGSTVTSLTYERFGQRPELTQDQKDLLRAEVLKRSSC